MKISVADDLENKLISRQQVYDSSFFRVYDCQTNSLRDGKKDKQKKLGFTV